MSINNFQSMNGSQPDKRDDGRDLEVSSGPNKIFIADFESLSKIDRDSVNKDTDLEFSSAMKVASSIVLAKILAKSSSVGGVAKIAYNGIMQFIQNKDYLSVADYASRFKELELGVVVEDESEHDNYAALTEAYASKSDDDYGAFGEVATEEDFDLEDEADGEESQDEIEDAEGEMEEFTDADDEDDEFTLGPK